MARKAMPIRGREEVSVPVALPSLKPAGEVIKVFPGEDYETAVRRLWGEAKSRWLAIGELLLEWKGETPRGEFMQLVADRLPFEHATANKLMIIAEAVAKSPALSQALPPTYTVAYEVVSLPEPVRREAIEKGLITPDTTRKVIVDLKKKLKAPSPPPAADRRAELEKRIARLKKELSDALLELAELDLTE